MDELQILNCEFLSTDNVAMVYDILLQKFVISLCNESKIS